MYCSQHVLALSRKLAKPFSDSVSRARAHNFERPYPQIFVSLRHPCKKTCKPHAQNCLPYQGTLLSLIIYRLLNLLLTIIHNMHFAQHSQS